MVTGLRSGIMSEIEAIGPNNFIVDRYDGTQIVVNDGTSAPPWQGKPPITMAEAELIAALPSIRSVAVGVQTGGEVKFGATVVENVQLLGRGYQWPDYTQGDFIAGRNYLPIEEQRSSMVTVISKGLADAIAPGWTRE